MHGRCLVTSINRDNFNIITVVLQADTKKIRTKDSINLIEYVYKNYELVNMKDIVDEQFNEWYKINANRITINKGVDQKLQLYIENLEDDVIPIRRMQTDNIKVEITNINYCEAPVKKDTIIGTIKVLFPNGDIIDVIQIKCENEIKKKEIKDYFKIFAFEMFS